MIIKLLKFVIFAICTLKWYACIYFKKKLYKVHIMHIAAHAYSLYCLSFSHAKTVNRSTKRKKTVGNIFALFIL